MGGHICVQSTVGTGSVFWFVLPFERQTLAARENTESIDTDPAPAPGALRILLVDDSLDNRMIALAYLEDTPYQVDVAENGAIAIEKYRSGNYDLVLMDRQMPVVDGLTATRQIREWEHANRRRTTPIIALTASALKGDREVCLAAGCTAYLTKPIKQDALLRSIRDLSITASPSPVKSSLVSEAVASDIECRVAGMAPKFLSNTRRNALAMLDALDRNDFDAVGFLGHTLTGAGAMFGFHAITEIGRALEHAAEQGDAETLRACVSELASYLDQAEQSHPPTVPGPPDA